MESQKSRGSSAGVSRKFRGSAVLPEGFAHNLLHGLELQDRPEGRHEWRTTPDETLDGLRSVEYAPLLPPAAAEHLTWSELREQAVGLIAVRCFVSQICFAEVSLRFVSQP